MAILQAPTSARDIGEFGHNPLSNADRANRAKFALLWKPLEAAFSRRNWGVSPGAVVERQAVPIKPRRIKRIWLSPTRGTFRIRLDGQTEVGFHEMHHRLKRLPSMPFGTLAFVEITLSRAGGKEPCLEASVPIERFFSGCRGQNAMAKRIANVVLSVIDTADEGQDPTDAGDLADIDLLEAPEGGERLVTHLRRERSPKLRNAKIAAVLRSESGNLICEACDFDFAVTYGKIGKGFAEVHHRKQLANSGPRKTALSDLAVLCSNCHRIIHRTMPMWSVPRLRKHVNAKR
jgi:hypothetical protein